MKILVTGASGFIGRRLCSRLLKKGHAVTGTGRSAEVTFAENDLRYVQADLTNSSSCLKALDGIEAVIHCAGRAGTWGTFSDYHVANVISTQRLIEACQKSHVRRFINISSPSIYFAFKDQFDLKEHQIPKKLSNAYASTKYEAEKLVAKANGSTLKTLSLRPRGVLGAGDKNWLPRIIGMRRRDRLIQPGDGKNLVDFTSIENLLDAIELALDTQDDNFGRTYNITNGKPEVFWDFIETALGEVDMNGDRKRVPLNLAMGLARISEGFHKVIGSKKEPSLLPIKVGVAAYSMTLDISAAQSRLGYQPRVSTDEALREFTEWWKSTSHSPVRKQIQV